MSEPVHKTRLSGWGRYPVEECHVYRPERRRTIGELLASGKEPHYIGRGNGRSYGDAATNGGGGVITSLRLDRMIGFDGETGVVECEAGVTFKTLIDVFLPRGWFVPVTPGTKLLTVGGAIAHDVHGKNHHRDGSFASALLDFQLLIPSGEIFTCSRDEHNDVFWATVGGAGLTGMILTARFRLQRVESGYCVVDYLKTADLDGVLAAIQASDKDYHYSMAWVDTLSTGGKLGRSVLMRGNLAKASDLPARAREQALTPGVKRRPSVPVDFPQWVLNPLSIKAFNSLYYRLSPGTEGRLLDYDSYFFPLDAIGHWNRMYGRRGFVQYQVTVPLSEGKGLAEILELSAMKKRSSFLAVLKKFGAGNEGMLSHPFEGYTLTLDIPVHSELVAFLHALDRIALDHGGRLYLAKDAVMSAETFRAMYPKVEEFMAVRAAVDPEGRLSSTLARRLGLAEGRIR